MNAVLGELPSLDGRSRMIGSLKDDCFLGGGCDAHIESDLSPISPVVDENVRRSGERTGDEARQFLLRIEGSALGGSEDGVTDPVVPAAFHSVIVVAVKGVVSKIVLWDGAGGGAAVAGGHEGDAETVPHRRPEGPRVHVEVEGWRREGIQPVPSVRKSERVETGAVAGRRRGEKFGEIMGVNFGGERVLGGRRRKKRER